jgi:hypothetical protein
MGSILAALRAGGQLANAAIAIGNCETRAKVHGSRGPGVQPNRQFHRANLILWSIQNK